MYIISSRIIGEEKTLSIKVGSQAKLGPGQAPLADDVILIRGPSNEVDRAAREIRNIVDKAQNDEIDNGHVSNHLPSAPSSRLTNPMLNRRSNSISYENTSAASLVLTELD
jgi:hypothetical protein